MTVSILAPGDVALLTGTTRRAKQRAELDALGIAYGVRRDGSIIVLRSAMEAKLGASPAPQRREPRLRLDETTQA